METRNVLFEVDLIDVLFELRAQLSVRGIQYFKDIKESGNNIMTQCPYHKDGHEKKPSAGFRKSDAVLHCFTCGATHSLPEVISYCFGYEDNGDFGFKWLLSNFATISVEERKDINLDYTRVNSTIHSVSDSESYVTEEELQKYRYYHKYWEKRRITDPDVIELFDLGYDRSSRCITFPIKDEDGHCLFIARRSVDTKWFNYPKDSDKPLYGLYEAKTLDKFPMTIIICESMLDALRFWQIGKVAFALNGLGSDEQFKMLSKLPNRAYILCTDCDESGLKARKTIVSRVKNHMFTQYFLPSGCKDANDCTDEQLLNLREEFV